jgi:hypothetical protein
MTSVCFICNFVIDNLFIIIIIIIISGMRLSALGTAANIGL